MTDHYRESVEMVESVRPGSVFLPDLRRELRELDDTLRRETSGG
jgi:hypothetical protein